MTFTTISVFDFVVFVFVVYRMSHLIAYEDGPWDIIARARAWVTKKSGKVDGGFWGKLMDCPYCVSLWVSGLICLVFTFSPVDAVGISGATCFLLKWKK